MLWSNGLWKLSKLLFMLRVSVGRFLPLLTKAIAMVTLSCLPQVVCVHDSIQRDKIFRDLRERTTFPCGTNSPTSPGVQ